MPFLRKAARLQKLWLFLTHTTGMNDMLMVGPTIQQDLISIELRFRLHMYAMTADISKMYRQIRMHPEDCDLQRILWRRSSDEPLKQYQLVTVTYGTAPASFLATRCLNQLASEEASLYPLAAKVISRDMYVDDLVTGSDNLAEARRLQEKIIHILGKWGFALHKWCANHADLHEGLLGPVIVHYMISIQQLWLRQITWDEELPRDLQEIWKKLYRQLPALNSISIPRLVKIKGEVTIIQIHGFSDTSQRAFGACVYIRSGNTNGELRSRLLCSKSRVSPVKQVSIPRLELCGAQLLARLINYLFYVYP